MCASGLSPFTNRWNQVHNFTPETRKHKISKKGEENQHPVVDQKVLDLFESFIEGKCSIDNHEFSMNAQSSAFFVSDLEGNLKNGEVIYYTIIFTCAQKI